MKLYRGLKSSEFVKFDMDIQNELKEGWAKIIAKRNRGDFKYPGELNETIISLEEKSRFINQNFTDDKELALRYARGQRGALIEIDVPVKDILDFFTFQFQNFTKRRKKFEFVYVVKGSDLAKNAKKWKFKLATFS